MEDVDEELVQMTMNITYDLGGIPQHIFLCVTDRWPLLPVANHWYDKFRELPGFDYQLEIDELPRDEFAQTHFPEVSALN